VIALEKQGVSQEGVDLLTYIQTNCLQNRLEDYVLCLQNMQFICPEWEGESIFWGESEGGMLAASLAGQTPHTAAVLLFGAGGGMKPREEVKWALQNRLEKHKVMQDEMDDYMNFLDEQMDTMILDSTSEKQFLGNTYKWWASFLMSDKAIVPLNQQFIPICLIHGVEDSQIPISSADLAAEELAKTNTLTYLRLEGYGHDLNTADVQRAINHWLSSILFKGEFSNDDLVFQATFSVPTSLDGLQFDLSNYIFNRGRDKDRDNKEKDGGKGDMYGSVRGDKDSSGNESVSADGGVRYHSDNNRWSVDISGGGSIGKDSDGKANAEGHVKAEVVYGF